MAAWDYVQNFDGLSTVILGGQDSWDGTDVNLTVQTGVVLQGTKSVKVLDAITTSVRTVSFDSGIWYFMRQCDSAPGGGDQAISFRTATNYMTVVKFTGSAPLKLQYYSSGAYSDLVGSASTSTLYWVGIDYDGAGSQFKIRVGTSGGWSGDWSAYVPTGTASTTSFDSIRIGQDAGTSYLDNFTTTDPFAAAGPANLKSLDTNLKANIKSYNTNLIANVKSINTNV